MFMVVSRGKSGICRKDYSYRPTVTVYVPTFNEERNIEKKLNNILEQDYAVDEILVIDCSTDRTSLIVQDYARRHPKIKLVSQPQRTGMARTLNDALSLGKTELLIKTDCDSIVHGRDALNQLVANFGDPRVGGVTGICVSEGIEASYRSLLTRLQIAESAMDSTIVAHASSLLAFRRSCAEYVDEDSMADDTEEFVRIRKRGYRTILDPSVRSTESLPRSWLSRRAVKDRRAEGIVRVLVKHSELFLNRKYGLYGMFIVPSNLFLLSISPFLLMADVVALALLMVAHPQAAPIALIVLGAVLAYRSAFLAFLDVQVSGFVATLNFLLRRARPVWKRVV